MADNAFDFSDYHRTVIGFHGTSVEAADRLVAGEPFEPSDRDIDWFGKGVYFWEHAPKQAWRWAKEVRKHEHPAVVGAVIRLGNCLDLLDPGNVSVLKEFKTAVVDKYFAANGLTAPENFKSQMRLDRAVFNLLYARSDETDSPIESARAVFVPTAGKKRIWNRSWIYDETHIQVCVRETGNILAAWHVREDGRYGKDVPGEGQE